MSTLSVSDLQTLIEKAREVRVHSHAPYSGYRVGAALLSVDGKVFTGVNVENCAYPTSMCAERNVLATAVGAGHREFECIVIATVADKKGMPGTPCGACRQALGEFGLDLEVILVCDTGPRQVKHVLRDLLPNAFTPESLEDG